MAIVDFLIGGTIYNCVFIIFGIIAWFRASKMKSYSGLIIGGLLLNAIPYFGFFAGLKRNPELYGQTLNGIIGTLIYLAIFLCLILFACSKSFKEAKAKQGKDNQISENSTAVQNQKADENRFICTTCGTTNKGWYQTCPHCGAVGKMKKNV